MKLKLKYLLLTAMFIVSMVARGQDFNPEDPIEPAATPINLKVVVVPAGAGTVKGGGKYKAGTSVTLSTTRNEGYVFLHWEDSKGNILSESTQFTYVKKSYEEVITARYKEIPHLRVKVSPEGAGSVSGGGQYDAGTKVKVNTSGNTGFVFKCWTNEAGDTLAMTQSYEHTKLDVNEVLIANYQFEPGNPIEPSEPSLPEPPVVIPKYNLTLHATEGGNVTGGGMYEEGTSVKVKATANTGFYFKGWLNQAGDTVSATAEFTYAMQAMDTTFVAHFEFNPSAPIEPSEPNITPPAPVLPSYSVSVLTTEGGSVTSTHTSAKEGETVTIKATVQTGFVFAGWFNADTLVTTNTSYSFVMGHEAVEYLAKFEFNPSGPIEPNVPSMKDNSLYLMTIAAKPGDAAECVVYFNAIKEITDLTFQLGFPKGIALQSESLNISTNVQGYTIDYALKNDSTIVFNMTGGKLDVGNVKLLSMTVNVPEEYPVGVGNKVSVNQVSVSYPDGTSSTVSTRNSSLDVYKYGDADNSGVIDVVDLIMARDFYYGVYIDGFEYVAVDLNRNGVVDSEDITMLKQLILEQAYETVVPKSRSIDTTGKNIQTAFDVKFSSYNVVKDSVAMNLYLSADNAIKGFQLDVELPSSVTFNDVAPQMMKDWLRFDVDFKAVSNRKMRLLVTSGSNAMFPIGETNVLSCNVNVNKLQLDSLTLSDGVVVKDDYSTLKSEGKFPTYSKSKLYCITYKVDGKTYQTDSIAFGATITPVAAPQKEGYTFTGWDGLPDVMPAEDVEVSALFDVNVYRITYKVDGKTYQTDSIAYGTTIVPVDAPTQTGRTFVGWDGLPETMPAKDVEVTAKFDVNVYRLTYKVDGKTYQTDSIAYGATIVPPTAPTKIGHTFVGWDGLPETMPAKDVEVTAKFDVNVYRITYKVDGKTHQTDSIAYGATIVPPTVPKKTGHTFTGWDGLPETMPAKDVEVTAKFDVNVYRLTYKVDGKTYQTDSIAYGATIVPPTAPTKTGHTFTGWDGLPETMPAKDVEVTAKFDVNVYRITYKVDGKIYQTDSIAFAESIVLPTAPTKTGHTFIGWDGLPETMPAKDVEVTAKFDVNVYRLTYKVDGETYQTDSIAFAESIVPPTAPIKEGYLFNGWDGLPDVMPAKDVEVTAKYSLNPVQTDEQGVRYELNAVSNTFEAKGTTDELVADIVLPATIYDVPVSGIAAEAFKDAEIQTLVIPATIQEVGDDAFVGCTELRWVDWQAQAQARAECFDAPEVHGNMLLFCYGEQAPDYAGNVVVNGKAKEIVLIDARPYASPYDYEAENICFTKTFTKETMIGTGAGWEGIVVPFDVEQITFGDKVIAPFGATGQYSDIPCWLAQMKDENFVMTDAIKADEAYIMAVPNSEAYDDDYNVEGDVRFEATNARLKATSQMATTPVGGLGLIGTYEPVEAAANVFTLNDEEYWKTYDGMMAPGSVFVQGLRDVRPFEAYVSSSKALHMACLKIGNVLPTNIAGIQNDSADAEAWYTLQGKRLNTKPVQTGFYLHGGKLEFVRQR